MPPDTPRLVAALIDRIQTRFHDGHRLALAQCLPLAEWVEGSSAADDLADGLADGLADALRGIGNALEQHMFKEEMRLFPMMEQGGNTLIGRLIEDLHREHVDHLGAMQGFCARLAVLGAARPPDPTLGQLIQGMTELATELATHIRTEDTELFPLFEPPHH